MINIAIKRKSQAERLKAMKDACNAINKAAGETIIGNLENEEIVESLKIEYIPTASYRLNAAFGGGWPRGKMSLITGASDSGKTARLLEDMAKGFKEDPEFLGVWIESENSLEEKSIEMFGINSKDIKGRFYFLNAGDKPGEEILDYVVRMAYTGVDMIVINSLKCLTPGKEFKDSMADANVALQARLNSKFMRVIIPTIAKSGTSLCIVQHLSTDIGGYSMHGVPTTISGGLAIRYNNVLTVEYRKGNINAAHPLYSVRDDYMLVKAKVTKNHCDPTRNPFVATEYLVKYGEGTDVTSEILEEVFNNNILVKAGAWIREYNESGPQDKGNERILPDGTKASWQGMAKFTEYINNNPDYFEYLKDKVVNNIVADALTEEEINEIKEQELLENKEIEELIDMAQEETEGAEA